MIGAILNIGSLGSDIVAFGSTGSNQEYLLGTARGDNFVKQDLAQLNSDTAIGGAYANNQFYVTYDANGILTTSGGGSWARIDSNAPSGRSFFGIVSDGDEFLAFSPDGINNRLYKINNSLSSFSIVSYPSGVSAGNPSGFAYANDEWFLAVAGGLYRAVNLGDAWINTSLITESPSSAFVAVPCILYKNGIYALRSATNRRSVQYGASLASMTSIDLTGLSNSTNASRLSNITYLNNIGRWVGVQWDESRNMRICYSDNNFANVYYMSPAGFTCSSAPFNDFALYNCNDVLIVPFVKNSNQTVIAVSYDGINWVEQSLPVNSAQPASFINPYWREFYSVRRDVS